MIDILTALSIIFNPLTKTKSKKKRLVDHIVDSPDYHQHLTKQEKLVDILVKSESFWVTLKRNYDRYSHYFRELGHRLFGHHAQQTYGELDKSRHSTTAGSHPLFHVQNKDIQGTSNSNGVPNNLA